MSEFAVPLFHQDRGWLELRERLASAAREIHFAAIASDATNGAALLTVAENLAGLAMSIPLSSSQAAPAALVDARTLHASQVLGSESRTDGDDGAGGNRADTRFR